MAFTKHPKPYVIAISVLIFAPPAAIALDEMPGNGLNEDLAALAGPVAPEDLAVLRDAFIDAGDFLGALPPAEEAVRIVQQRSGPDSMELAAELSRLGLVQRETGNLRAAEGTYLRSIEILESSAGQFDISLVDPYVGLAKTYNADERFAQASTVLEQARHVSRRNLGLFNVDQTPLIDELTVSALGMGDTVGAQQLQRQRLDLALKTYGKSDERTVPYRYYLANYYKRSRMKNHARKQYQRVVELREKNTDDNDPSLLRPLREIVRLNLILDDRGFEARRIRNILEESADIAPMERAHSLATLGDWLMVYSGDDEHAQSYYRAAYEALQGIPEEERRAFFRTPLILDFIPPVTRVDVRNKSKKPVAWGRLTLEFTVEADGKATGVQVVSAEPADLMENKYVRRIGDTHFRPRLVNGEPVATKGVRFSHSFRYFAGN